MQLHDIRVGPVDRIKVGLDVPHVPRLHLASIGVACLEAAEGGLGVHRAKDIGVVERGGEASLAEQAALNLGDGGDRREGDPADIGRSDILGAELLSDPRAGVVFVELVVDDDGPEGVGRFKPDAGAIALHVAGVRVIAGHDVLAKTVALQVGARKAYSEGVADGGVDHAAQLDRVVVAVFCARQAL